MEVKNVCVEGKVILIIKFGKKNLLSPHHPVIISQNSKLVF